EVDRVVDVARQLEVEPGGWCALRVGRPPGQEGGWRHLARGPELVAAVAAHVDEAGGLQPAARAVDGKVRVGHIDVSRLLRCRHSRFRILSGFALEAFPARAPLPGPLPPRGEGESANAPHRNPFP